MPRPQGLTSARVRRVTAWLWECVECRANGIRLTEDGAKIAARKHQKEEHPKLAGKNGRV